MEYISATEASEKWGVSVRQVQRLLADHRIPYAKKYGRSWMIPWDTEKPVNKRREKQLSHPSLSSDLNYVMVSTTIPMSSNHPDTILNSVKEERLRLPYEAELSYLRGDFQYTMQCFYKTEGDDAARLRICPVAIGAAISLGDYQSYTEIDAYLKRCVKVNKGNEVSTIAELALATAAVSVYAPNMVPDWLKEGNFSQLMPQTRTNALYLRAKYYHCIGKYEAMLAVAQTALTLDASEQGITQTNLYLRVTCAVASYSLGRIEEAKRWLLEAMSISLPHNFITPFAELITMLGGLVELCLKQNFPTYYDAVIRQWELTGRNWIIFHNQFTKDNISFILSLRELHIAKLASSRVPYAIIAEQFSISVGRLKNIMQEIYEKLFISNREELSYYVTGREYPDF